MSLLYVSEHSKHFLKTVKKLGSGYLRRHVMDLHPNLNNDVNANKIVGMYWVLNPSSLGPHLGLRFAPFLGGSSAGFSLAIMNSERVH